MRLNVNSYPLHNSSSQPECHNRSIPRCLVTVLFNMSSSFVHILLSELSDEKHKKLHGFATFWSSPGITGEDNFSRTVPWVSYLCFYWCHQEKSQLDSQGVQPKAVRCRWPELWDGKHELDTRRETNRSFLPPQNSPNPSRWSNITGAKQIIGSGQWALALLNYFNRLHINLDDLSCFIRQWFDVYRYITGQRQLVDHTLKLYRTTDTRVVPNGNRWTFVSIWSPLKLEFHRGNRSHRATDVSVQDITVHHSTLVVHHSTTNLMKYLRMWLEY